MKGYNTHRHQTNPKEKELHDKFNNDFIKSKFSTNTIDRLIFGHTASFTPKDYLNDREKQIVLSTIQWLGSPVGKSFLKHCGFELKI